MNIFTIIGYCCIFIGIFLTLTTMLGFARFNNIYTRIHISTINDMLAIPMAIVGTAFLFLGLGDSSTFIKLLLAVVIWYIIAPVTSYIIIKVVYFYRRDDNVENL